jgi:DNA-binding transcriptional MerR regulator
MESKFITVKEISSKYELSYQVVNRYSDAGLLAVAFKKGNTRYYERRSVDRRIRKISTLAREGYSLTLIRRQCLGR